MATFPKGNMMGMLQQAKQVQEKIEKLQGELATLRIKGEAGGGMVMAEVDGQQRLIQIRIDPELISEDIEMVEDLVVAAIRQAMDKSKNESAERMNAITGGMLSGLNIPGM